MKGNPHINSCFAKFILDKIRLSCLKSIQNLFMLHSQHESFCWPVIAKNPESQQPWCWPNSPNLPVSTKVLIHEYIEHIVERSLELLSSS